LIKEESRSKHDNTVVNRITMATFELICAH